ncbi:MAG TPA: hypothetical protein ENJ95_17215 [Bacteroidetes bacterium]|nr:hypothetical protein [Bacteroidota bacterium]
MKNSPLFRLVSSFGPIEQREAGKFLRSPFFNTRHDLVLLFEYLLNENAPEKEPAWAASAGKGKAYDEQKCRLMMSYLHKLLEQYLVIKEVQKEGLENRLRLLRAYRQKGMATALERSAASLKKVLEKQPLRDTKYLAAKYGYLLEHNRSVIANDPTNATFRHQMESTLDALYLSTRLRLICESISQQGVYSVGEDGSIDEGFIALAEKKEWKDMPAVSTYLHCFYMLSQPDNEAHFQVFKKDLLALDGQLAAEEMRGLYLMAVNYCIRRLNEGEGRYSAEIFDLYKPGIESGYLLENGVLSRFTYHNIAAAGLKTGALEWVRQFIHEHKNSLERRYRESSFSFNLARLEYARRRFDTVLELLQKANYRDPLLNLSAKTLLLKTYYELAEYDLLQSHLDAMRNYIRRKRVIGYHKKNYLNIVRFAEKLLRVNFLDKKEVAKLRKAVLEEEVLTEKEWLLGWLG